jgi:hypothetical protein
VTRLFSIQNNQLTELSPSDTPISTSPGFFNERGPAIVTPNGQVYTVLQADFPSRVFTLSYSYDPASNQFDLVDVAIDLEEPAATTPDKTPPITFALLSGTLGQNKWYTSTVKVSLKAVDDQSGVKATYYQLNDSEWQLYQAPFYINNEGLNSLHYYSVDNANNTETANIKAVKIDSRRPLLTAWSDSLTYTRVQTYTVHYQASDPTPGSGIYTTTATLDGQSVVNNQAIDIFWYRLGTHSVVVTATDNAGWVTQQSTSFQLIATLDSLRATIIRLRQMGEIDNDGVENSFLVKVDGAIDMHKRGKDNQAINKLDALINDLNAQSAKHITQRGSALLIGDTQYVEGHLQ